MPDCLRVPAIQLPVSPERMATASEAPPSLAMTLETLMPLPPASRLSSVMRFTASTVKLGDLDGLVEGGVERDGVDHRFLLGRGGC